MPDPKVGEMVLYDYIRPPLLAGEYRMRVGTEVSISSSPKPLPGQDFFFDVEGPRFALAPNEVAGVFPPRNGHGPFDSALPHVALGRRTLPWERPLGDAYTAAAGDTPYPFLALVLLEQSECEIKHNMALTDVVPHDVFVRLGQPPGIRCDAVEADEQLLRDILPMPEELQLLTHVRQVNVDDRELAAGDSDGYFAVVMSNRVPRSGASYVCCLVSVEERTDLLPATDIIVDDFGSDIYLDATIAQISEPSAITQSEIGTSITAEEADRIVRVQPPPSTVRPGGGGVQAGAAGGGGIGLNAAVSAATGGFTMSGSTSAGASAAAFKAGITDKTLQKNVALSAELSTAEINRAAFVLHPKARLVLLHSWTFGCEGDGTFRQLMQRLDVGMIGDIEVASKLPVTDTGHIKIDVIDRLGAPEQSWYRGPLVSQPLTRDPLGPYHSADQARRVVAETGAENISYAAAFEAGRLLAAADARLAQELLRWRRRSFRSSARQSAIDRLADFMRLNVILDPLDPVALRYSVDVLAKISNGIAPPTDPYGIEAVLASPLLQPEIVAKAFGLPSVDAVAQLLGADIGLSQAVTVPKSTRITPTTTLDQVLADRTGAAGLAQLRVQAIGNLTGDGTVGQPNQPNVPGRPNIPGNPDIPGPHDHSPDGGPR
jgi:hypothetical protein